MDCNMPGSSVWDFPGKNIGVDCHFLPQGIFPNQGLNPHLLSLWHWQMDYLTLNFQGTPGKGSVQSSCSVMSDSLWPYGLQHARPPCPSPAPGVYSSSCPLSRWCHPTTSSSIIPFSCPQSFPASGSFPMSQLFTSEAKVLEFQLQHQPFQWIFSADLLRMDCLDLLAVQGTLKSLLQHHNSKASILQCSAFFIVQLSHPFMTTGKTIALTRWTSVGKVMSLLFNKLSRGRLDKNKARLKQGWIMNTKVSMTYVDHVERLVW